MFTRKPYCRLLWSLSFILAAAALVAAGHIATPDGHLRLVQAAELLDHHSFALPNDVGNVSHGNIAEGTGGQRFSVYNPGHIVLLTLPLLAARALPEIANVHEHYVAAFLASFLGPLAHFLCAGVLFLTGRLLRFPSQGALIGALIYAFCTIALPHAKDGYEHPFIALALMLAFYFAISFSSSNDGRSARRAVILCATAVGFGVLFRSTTVLAIPGLLILLWDRRAWAIFGVVLAPFLGVIAMYNLFRFGSPLEFGYWQAWQHTAPSGQGYFSKPLPDGLYGLWLSPGKGLLLFSPALIAAVSGLPELYQTHRRLVVAIAVTTVAYSVFYASNFAWHGSPWSWGPRYLIPVVPLLMLGFPIHFRDGMGPSIMTIGVVVVSLGIQALAISADYRRHLIYVQLTTPHAFHNKRIFFDTRLSPILGQAIAAKEVIARSVEQRPVYYYRSPGRWKDHGKTVPASTDLYNGIDYNVPDFWWARLASLHHGTALGFVGWGVGAILAGLVAVSTVMFFRVNR